MSGSAICPEGFYVEDPEAAGYYLREIDIYQSVPVIIEHHALSIRKRIKDDVFELYTWAKRPLTRWEKVVKESKDLQIILDEANIIWNKVHGTKDFQREVNKVCKHKYPVVDMWDCPDELKQRKDDHYIKLLAKQNEARRLNNWVNPLPPQSSHQSGGFDERGFQV